MIRQATKYDKTRIIELMQLFRAESPIKEMVCEDNHEYWNQLLDNIFAGAGAVFIDDDKGLLMCMVLPTIWNEKIYALHELAWYVKPEYRGGTTGYKLFRAYIDYGQQLKESGRVSYFTMTKLVTSPDIDYGKFGFRKTDENWIQ